MFKIYLDNNAVSYIAGIPSATNVAEQLAHAMELKEVGHRFVLSAWNMYELARSNVPEHVESCIRFIEEIAPLWAASCVKVESQELDRFLQWKFDVGPTRSRLLTPLLDTVGELWTTFGETPLPFRTFRDTVTELRSNPTHIEHIKRAAKDTPDAIQIGRLAKKEDLLKISEFMFDREYLAQVSSKNVSSEQLDFSVRHHKELLAVAPTLAAHDQLLRFWVNDSFTPEDSDAIDMQHVLVPLNYCDYVVTNDKHLTGACQTIIKRLKLGSVLARNILDVPVTR